MEIQFADRMQLFKEGIFTTLNNIKKQRMKEGKVCYDLSVGTPDFLPAPHVMEALTKASLDPENYK